MESLILEGEKDTAQINSEPNNGNINGEPTAEPTAEPGSDSGSDSSGDSDEDSQTSSNEADTARLQEDEAEVEKKPHLLVRLFGPDLSSNSFIDKGLTKDEYERFEFYRARTRVKSMGDIVEDYMKYYAQNLLTFFLQNLRDLRARKVNFLLGFLSCLILVVVSASAPTIVNQLPVIYLQLAEESSSEIDLLFKPTVQNGVYHINYTAASKELVERGGTKYQFSTARYGMLGTVLTEYMCNFTTRDLLNNQERRYSDPYYPGCDSYSVWSSNGCLKSNCFEIPDEPFAFGYLINSVQEKVIGLGRRWNNRPLGPGECYIDISMANNFDLRPGDEFFYVLQLPTLYNIFVDKYEIIENHPEFVNNTKWALGNGVALKLKVVDVVRTSGKFSLPNLAIMEMDSFLQMVTDALYQDLPQEYLLAWNQSNIYDTVTEMIVNLPPDRTNLYIDNEFDAARFEIIDFASNAHYLIGFSQMEASTSLIDALNYTQFLSMYLSLVINVVLVILSTLSIVLVYSLFVMSVERRTKELGMLRMIGMPRTKLFFLLFMQSLFFGIPSVIVGLIISKGISYGASYFFSSYTSRDVTSDLDLFGLVLAISLGMLVPIVSGLLPIKLALSKNVFESINQRTERNKAVVVKVERTRRIDVWWNIKVISAGLFLSALGFVIYFFFPLSLITLNIVLMGNIFLGILTGLLLGLSIISLNIQHVVERILVWIVLFFEFSSIKLLMLKNLQAHRSRNRKTSIMYSIAISFMIFLLVAYNSIVAQLVYGGQQSQGATITITSTKGMDSTVAAALDKVCADSPVCDKSTWISTRLNVLGNSENVEVTNIGRLETSDCWVRAVSPDLFSCTFDGFLIMSQYNDFVGEEYVRFADSDPLKYLTEILYTSAGSEGGIMAEGDRITLAIPKLGYPAELVKMWDTLPLPTYIYKKITTLGFIEAAPGVTLSKMGSRNDVLLSYPTLITFLDDPAIGMDDMTYHRYLVPLSEDANPDHVDALKFNLAVALGDVGEIWHEADTADILGILTVIVDYVFILMIAIAMGICFFSILASMSTNIFEHTTELAILRSIGLTKIEAVRLYIEEAFIIILSSSALGIFSGTLVGWTLVAQSTLFTQLPLPFYFPFLQVAAIFFLSIFFAFISTFFPSIYLLYFKSIVQLHRILA